MDTSTLQSLLGGESPAVSLFDPAKLLEPLMPFIVIFTVLSILLTLLYLVSIVQKWRANNAVIEIRNILREMNARQKPAAPSIDAASAE